MTCEDCGAAMVMGERRHFCPDDDCRVPAARSKCEAPGCDAMILPEPPFYQPFCYRHVRAEND